MGLGFWGRSGLRGWVLLGAGVLLATSFGVVVAPAAPVAAAAGFAACTEGGVTWRVDYSTRDSIYGGPLYKVTALSRNGVDASTQTWQLRWDLQPSQYPAPPPPPPAAGAPSYNELTGPLGGTGGIGGREVVNWLSPRVVTPDGTCTVYLVPYGNRGLSAATAPRVAVLGDDHVRQLNDSTANVVPNQGYVERDLNPLGARTEVEGHVGARWVAPSGTSGTAAADKTLLDEFRGLLEHETDGFVVALGINDALDLAAGDPATLETRIQAYYASFQVFANELRARSGCVTMVTIPDIASSLDPEYQHAAQAVNNGMVYYDVLGGEAMNLVDFAARARDHAFGSAQPWFLADNVHLAGAGIDAYTDAVTEAARRCSESVVLYGRAGTLDLAPPDGNYAGRSSLPTGQPLVKRAVPGWEVLPSRLFYRSVAAADGTVFFANNAHSWNPFEAGGNPNSKMVISALDPNANAFSTIEIKTDRGNVEVVTDEGEPRGFDVSDLEMSPDGTAVMFTGGTGVYDSSDATRDSQGMWPVFGILTKAPDGTWRVAEGPIGADGQPAWRNQWSPRELYAAATDKTLADSVCPLIWFSPLRDCRLFTELDTLPNGDIVVSQYFGGGVTVLRPSGPDTAGRYSIDITARYQMPVVDDPSSPTAGVNLGVSPREVEADPTSGGSDGNDLRFGLSSDTWYSGNVPHPSNITEFRYDPSNPDPFQRIQPVSAPTMTGEIGTQAKSDGKKRFVGSSPFIYDHLGNLWVGQGESLTGHGIAVYAKTGTGRRLSNGTCSFDPASYAGYHIDDPTGATRSAWGKACKPDFLLLQPRPYGPAWQIEEDPSTHAIGASSLNGIFYLIQPSGEGTGMTFSLSGPAASMGQQLQLGNTINLRPGSFDGSGRAWMLVRRFGAADDSAPLAQIDQWAFSLDVSRMLGREPLQLPVTAGRAKTVHAEQTHTRSTVRRTGTIADYEVDSVAGYAACTPAGPLCQDPVSAWEQGAMVLGDETSANAGIPANTTVEYRIVVPKDGSYQVRYRARDRGASGVQNLRLTVNGQTYEQEIASTDYATLTGPLVTLPAGTHTIQITAPTGGWQLDWLSFTRQ